MARGRSAPDAFRHEPPDLGPGLVLRGRLIDALRNRFERRLTVITAGAGCGKTTLLAQAVLENRLDRDGTDAWLRVNPADRDPTHLRAGLAQSLTGVEPLTSVDIDDLADLVWAAAPAAVALVLDDVHLLGEDGDPWDVVRDLLEQLPANGHLVLAGRQPPPLAMSRLLLDDTALLLDESALTFTEDELRTFGEHRSLPASLVAELPPWPALAVLTSAVGHGASASFLWEEVLSALPPWRQRLLAIAAAFDVLDDPLVAALDPGTGRTAADLVSGLPLIQSDGLGAYRLHPLLAEAVGGRADPADRRRTLVAAAGTLLDAGAERRAAEAAALAGDADLLRRAACRFATRPIASVSVHDVVAVFERLPPELRTAPIGYFLDAARHWGTSTRDALILFERTVERALEEGDVEVEALARWRVAQLRYLDDPDQLRLEPRLDDLAATGVPLARSTPAFIRSVEAQRAGRVHDAIAALDGLDGTDPNQRQATIAARMFDLGRPEAVPVSVESLLGPGPIDIFPGQALWLRGEVDPEPAWAIARSLPGVAGRKLQEEVAVRSVVAFIATASGALDEAEIQLERARAGQHLVGTHIRLIVIVSESMLALSRESEAVAVARLRDALALVPLGHWPARAYLYVLAPLRALLPAETEMLDELDLGPSLTLAVTAGRALAHLRRTGDPGPARALPWRTPTLLYAHVPPPLLAELALAAGRDADTVPFDVLDGLPEPRRWLERIAERSRDGLRTAAIARLGALPARPPYDLIVTTFGSFALARSDDTPIEEARVGRERVRQLLTHLLVRTRVHRHELAAVLWPDLSPAKAASNLRVNLRHLQVALQPDRKPNEPPWFIQTVGDMLVLADEGVRVDAHQFDHHVRQAVEAEGARLPSIALLEYRAACALYGGEFMSGSDDPAIEFERLRLRSLAQSAHCRTGELVLARGEPEAAMRVSVDALQLDTLSERAHRLFIRCHLAIGSLSAARAAGVKLIETLADEGLAPDDETQLLLRRLQIARGDPAGVR